MWIIAVAILRVRLKNSSVGGNSVDVIASLDGEGTCLA